MYKRVYHMLTVIFGSIGVGLIGIGGILFFTVGTQAGQLRDSMNQPVGMYVNTFLFLLFSGIGLVFIAIGLLMMSIRKMKERRERRLKEAGKVIYADIVSIQMVTSYSINRKHPYQVIAQYVDERTKTIYQYHSEYILEYPTYAEEGETVKIYVDPKNYKKYYIDLTDLLGKNGYRVETL